MAEFTPTGLKFWQPDRPDIIFEITDGAPSAAPARFSKPANYNRVLTMTPLDVLHYFQNSTELAVHAQDVADTFVRAGLIASQSLKNRPQQDLQLLQDLDAIEHLCDPIKADIAEVLLGTRYYAGSNADRVTKAFDAFYSSSSTRPKTPETQVEEIRAA